jgi:hypothetical protein
MMKGLSAALFLAVAVRAEATAPQMPIAEGPFESVMLATQAARNCGFSELRVNVRSKQTQLYIDGVMPSEEVQQCFESWMTPRGKELKFFPRWWNDNFTRDRP